jgi:hypothetical protein
MNLGIIGSRNFVKRSLVVDCLQKLKSRFGPTLVILSGGTDTGAELFAKKEALNFGLKYLEYNPSFTGYKMYSALPEEYYGKGFHPSHFHDRYRKLIIDSDRILFFLPKTGSLEKEIAAALKMCKKMNKSYLILK